MKKAQGDKVTEILTAIVQERFGIPTLETRHSDDLDFHEVSVWGLREVLQKAYEAGAKAARQ